MSSTWSWMGPYDHTRSSGVWPSTLWLPEHALPSAASIRWLSVWPMLSKK
jgi:hypothetical protein